MESDAVMLNLKQTTMIDGFRVHSVYIDSLGVLDRERIGQPRTRG